MQFIMLSFTPSLSLTRSSTSNCIHGCHRREIDCITPHSWVSQRIPKSPCNILTYSTTSTTQPVCNSAGLPPPSSADDIPSRIATAFVEACSPGSKPYATALKDFCRVSLDAYRSGFSLQALQLELSTHSSCLQRDELELRSVWLTLVYKTLRQIGFPARQILPDAPDKLDDFVKNIVAAVRAGYDIKRIQLEQSLSQGPNDKPRSVLESAVLGQSTRLVVTTISTAEDVLKDDNNKGDKKK